MRRRLSQLPLRGTALFFATLNDNGVRTEFPSENDPSSLSAPTSEEDRLARDISLLDKSKRDSKARGRVSISASQIGGGGTFWESGEPSSPPRVKKPVPPLPDIEVPDLQKETPQKVDPPAPPSGEMFIPKWSPSFAVPTNEELLPLSDISFTLEEIEQALFRTSEGPSPTSENELFGSEPAPTKKKTTPPPPKMPSEPKGSPPDAHVKVTEPPPTTRVPPVRPSAPEMPTEEKTIPPQMEKPVQVTPPVPPKEEKTTVVQYTNYGTDRLPCVVNYRPMAEPAAQSLVVEERPVQWTPFSTHFNPKTGHFTVTAASFQTSELSCISALHHSLNEFNTVRSAHRDRAVSISFEMENEKCGFFLCVSSLTELTASPLEQFHFITQRKQGLLSRLAALQKEKIRVIGVVSENMSATGFAAEFLLCCSTVQPSSTEVKGLLWFPVLAGASYPAPATVQRLMERWTSLTEEAQDEVWAQQGGEKSARGVGEAVAVYHLLTNLKCFTVHQLIEWGLLGEKDPLKKSAFTLGKAIKKLKAWFTTNENVCPPTTFPYDDVALRYLQDCASHESCKNSLLELLKQSPTVECRQAYRYLRRLEQKDGAVSTLHDFHPFTLFQLSEETIKGRRLIEEDIPESIRAGKKAVIVIPDDVADDVRVEAIASIQTTIREDDYTFIFTGPAHSFRESLSIASLAAVLSPVGPILSDSTVGAPVPPCEGQWDAFVELCVDGIHFPRGKSEWKDAALHKLLHTHAVTLRIVKELGRPCVITRTGNIGMAMLGVVWSVLAVFQLGTTDLKRMETDIQRSFSLTAPLGSLLASHGVANVHTAFHDLKELTMPVHTNVQYITENDLREVVENSLKTTTPFRAGAPLFETAEAVHLLCALVDFSLLALLHEYVLTAEDINALSIAALRLSPSTGGILKIADRRQEPISFLMRRFKSRQFESLPLLEYLARENITLSQVDQEVLRRAREVLP